MPANADWRALEAHLGERGSPLPEAVAFGLGAGVYFEYFQRPSHSPSRYFIGHNRDLVRNLDALLPRYLDGDKQGAVIAALRMNALAMDLDRSPFTAIMGMELLSEDLDNWAGAPDWVDCAAQGARAIRDPRSLGRSLEVQFLREVEPWFQPAGRLATTLVEIASEWDALAREFDRVASAQALPGLAVAARRVRRLALREENFWGQVLEATGGP